MGGDWFDVLIVALVDDRPTARDRRRRRRLGAAEPPRGMLSSACRTRSACAASRGCTEMCAVYLYLTRWRRPRASLPACSKPPDNRPTSANGSIRSGCFARVADDRPRGAHVPEFGPIGRVDAAVGDVTAVVGADRARRPQRHFRLAQLDASPAAGIGRDHQALPIALCTGRRRDPQTRVMACLLGGPTTRRCPVLAAGAVAFLRPALSIRRSNRT